MPTFRLTVGGPGRASSAEAAGLAQSIILTGAGSLGLVTLVAALYLAKSAAGINLLPGPSPLHDILYPLVFRL